MKKSFLVVFLLVTILLIGAACASQEKPADVSSIVEGGLLYDKWWKVDSGATEPSEDNPLWATQSSNTRSGSTTWRCKECHGWDYKGIDGAYSSGSHKTGFPGVYDAAMDNNKAQLIKILNGGNNAQHDLSDVLSDGAIASLADFLNEGLVDNSKYIDYSTKKTIGANVANGEELYTNTCAACHGADGKMIMFGDDDLKALANGNPWETLHKIRFGHPASAMPSGVKSGWSTQDSVDVLGYSQNLPE